MASAPPTISVVMPVYNAGRYLRIAVDSVLAQTHSDFEVVAVDDGSTDQTLALLREYEQKDPRVRIVSRPNTGIVGALNDGLAVTRGEFIARMDGDDWSHPERFARQLAHLRTYSNCVCVGSAFHYMDAQGALLKWNPRETGHTAIVSALLGGDGGALIHPSILVRRSALEAAGRYRREAEWVEDLDLYLRLAQIGELANLPEVLLHYRYHSQSVNFTKIEGRHQRKLWVMREACAARNLEFVPARWPTPPLEPDRAYKDACEFALSSLRFKSNRTPLRYATRALRLAPGSRRTWQTAGYVAKALCGFVPRNYLPEV